MENREEVLQYGLSFPDTYVEAPFHDANWQLVRVKDARKYFYGHMSAMDILILM